MTPSDAIKKYSFCAMVLAAAFLAGCSRTVTQMPSYGSEMNVEIKLAGEFDVTNNRYFVIFSTMEGYRIPLPPPDSTDEFLEPGDAPQPGGKTMAEYYSYYYSTWSAYVIVTSLGYTFVNGPFDINSPSTDEALAVLGNPSDTLSFSIRLERIFGTPLPKEIYFDIVTVDYPATYQKILKDRISPPTNSLEPIKGTIRERENDRNTAIDPSLDILHWKVTIP